MQRFYSNGKLLLTGEYLILDGALGLALPTKKGQDLLLEKGEPGWLTWESLDVDGNIWFRCTFRIEDLQYRVDLGDRETAETLQRILRKAKLLNPDFLSESSGHRVQTRLGFDRNWGLGSSSTLISNIAEWSATNPYTLLFESFGGSGYDIACARSSVPVLYRLERGKPEVRTSDFNPPFSDRLYFVFLNRKQSSRESIAKYRSLKIEKKPVEAISRISNGILKCDTLEQFEGLLREHERIIAGVLGLVPLQDREFMDYFGQIKSLGAWGGDFLLATGNEETPSYFSGKGFETVIPYRDMVL